MSNSFSISGGGGLTFPQSDGSDLLSSSLLSGNSNLFTQDSGDITDSSTSNTNNSFDASNTSQTQQMAAMVQMIMMVMMIMQMLQNLMGKMGQNSDQNGGNTGGGNTPQNQYDIDGGNNNGGNGSNPSTDYQQPVNRAYVPPSNDTQNSNNNSNQNSSNSNSTNNTDNTNSSNSTNNASDPNKVGSTAANGETDAGKTIQTGTGTGQTFNVTNNTGRDQYYAFSSDSSNTSGYSGNVNAVMKLAPGESAAFEAGGNVSGIRINSSGPNGESNGNQNLFEDTIQDNPYNPGETVHNPDVSGVAGHMSYDGNYENINFTAAGKTVGDDPNADIPAYIGAYDDTLSGSANPMQLGLTAAPVINISFS